MINLNQVNQGGLGSCYWTGSALGLAEWPNLIKNIFLTKNKNASGIFGISLFI
jgi:hypothetical protein